MHGAMPRPSRVQIHDVELGKRDDARRQGSSAPSTPKWNAAVPRLRKRRWAALIIAMGFFYIFFKNMPEDLTPTPHRADRRVPGRTVNNMPIRGPPKDTQSSRETPPIKVPVAPKSSTSSKIPKATKKPAPIITEKDMEESSQPLHYYDGAIRFPTLVTSLERDPDVVELSLAPKILFAAGNLQSAAVLIPMACGMAQATESEIHFAYFGRDDLPLTKLRELNGVKEGCKAIWHDARPDHSVHSSDERFADAITEAISTIYAYIRTEVFFVVEAPYEERLFYDGVKSAAQYRTIIEIPHKKFENLMWLTRLDGKSLSSWRDLDIKVLIQVSKENVGGLFQLLKSIYTADYTGHRHPHIIFEIPADLDIPSAAVVNDFSWPPRELGTRVQSKVTIRKRVSRRHEDPLASAIRTVESFYPTNPVFEHLLILSADVDLSPMWFHYLVYNVLEYGYSLKSASQFEPVLLAGISLITPVTYPNNETPFKPPKYTPPSLIDPDSKPPEVQTPDHVPFMWQTPDTMATLYFGAKWRELHSFLSSRINTANTPVTRKMPRNIAAFAEPLNELMSLRGWSVLYPNLPGHKIAAHQLNSATREEFRPLSSEIKAGITDTGSAKDTDPYTSASDTPKTNRYSSPPDSQTLATTPIHNLIPNKGVLSVLRWLPMLDFNGKSTTTADILSDAATRRTSFRETLGHCVGNMMPQRNDFTADDLFCTGESPMMDQSELMDELAEYDPTGQVISPDIRQKINRLNQPPPIVVDEEAGKRKLAQMKDEFLEHLQRQSSSGD